MSGSVDLLVVGGGVCGASAAYEATRRGHSVLLVERADFGSGASSNSLRILHGGLRYLQSLDASRYFESVRERRRLMQLAPAWVRPLPVRLDTSRRSVLYRLALRAGLQLNELASLHRNRGLDRARRLPRSRYPLWYDALAEDPERILLAMLHSAVALGEGRTQVHNYARLEGLELDPVGGKRARVSGLGEVMAREVLLCVGAGSNALPPLLAMNVVVDTRPMNAGGVAVGLRHPDDGRNVFVVPWRGCSVIGTYYRDYVGAPDAALRVERAWLDEFLAWLACVHPELRLAPHELRLLQAGLLPRARPGDTQPGDRPLIARGSCGELRVQPVKWTTAYGVAEQALDALALGPRQALRAGPGLPPLLDARTEPGSDAPFAGASFGAREVLFAVEREWARELADVLLRRTGAASTGHPGRSLVDAVSSVLQRKFDWPDAERRARIEEFDASFPFLGGRRP